MKVNTFIISLAEEENHYGSHFPAFFECLVMFDWMPNIINFTFWGLDAFVFLLIVLSFVLGYN